jgi:hypothetical protein
MGHKHESYGEVDGHAFRRGLQRSGHAEANAEQLMVIESKSIAHLYEPSVRGHDAFSRKTNMRMTTLK